MKPPVKSKDASITSDTHSICNAGEYDTGSIAVIRDRSILRTNRSISHERHSGLWDLVHVHDMCWHGRTRRTVQTRMRCKAPAKNNSCEADQNGKGNQQHLARESWQKRHFQSTPFAFTHGAESHQILSKSCNETRQKHVDPHCQRQAWPCKQGQAQHEADGNEDGGYVSTGQGYQVARSVARDIPWKSRHFLGLAQCPPWFQWIPRRVGYGYESSLNKVVCITPVATMLDNKWQRPSAGSEKLHCVSCPLWPWKHWQLPKNKGENP